MIGPSILFGKGSGVTAALILLVFFSMGATIGASGAVEGTPKATIQENMTGIEEETVGSIKENASGGAEPVAVGIARIMAGSAETMGAHGVNFGYEHPRAAELLGYATPLALVAWMGVLIYIRGKEVYRNG